DVRGARWSEISRHTGLSLYGLPQIAVRDRRATLYHTIAAGSSRRLIKIANINREGSAEPAYSQPAMRGFGSISVMQFNLRAPVFAVRPDDERVLIAADETSGSMKMTTNGGDEWTPMSVLTRLVTDDGRLRFTTVNDMNQVTVVAFDPYHPNRV